MKKLIVIADWAEDSLASQEVRTSIEGYLHDPAAPNITCVSSTSHTIHSGFILSQLIETEERNGRPLETVFFVNTDTRQHAELSAEESKGAEFIVVRLQSGIYICGPNAGKSFSFIKDKIQYAYRFTSLQTVSQFRSRDSYARVIAHLMDTMEDDLDLEEMHTTFIPEIDGFVVGHVDTFGTIKTNIPHEYLKGKYELNEMIPVEIHETKHMARYVEHLFAGAPGELIIYPGPTGHTDNPFIDISIWRNFSDSEVSASSTYKNPRPGMDIVLG